MNVFRHLFLHFNNFFTTHLVPTLILPKIRMLKKGRAPGFPLGPTQELCKFYSEIREEKPEYWE